ncbi:MAG: AraC family transcriptional regulator [Hungatella sp.]
MALTALSYRLYESGQDIYDQDVLCTQAPSISTNSIDTGELIHAIRKNDASAIETYCRHFFRSLLYVPMPPPSFIRGMSIYLVTDVQNALRKQTEHASLFAELPYGKINQLETFQELMAWSILLFQQYGESLSPYLCVREDAVILQAKQFIQDHMNRKIQAEDVASFVNLSPSYFAIYFKSKTGTNFRDYVSGIKMEYAKHLLATAHANISEVSYAVGYDDYRSFYRAFKNYTGMTPSEYQAKYEV